MNILIPHSWLLEHLKTEALPKKIQEYLSLCGPSVERIYKKGKESVYDIEVTTNRVDAMSIRGIAREAAVILEQFDIPSKLQKQSLTFAAVKPTAAARLPLPKIRVKSNLCRRVACVVLSNIQRTPTPKWMANRLLQIDANVHDSVIDITNYITHELGHPIHAFDYDVIMEMGGEIIITTAKAGEPFTTLDGMSYTAVGGEVVFKNKAGEIIDLPAVKGTANSSITDKTKNVLLWIESLDPAKVRFASMTHAIRTVAAQLSEKGVDPHLAEPTMVRGIELYQELCNAHIASEVYDSFPGEQKPKTVVIDLAKIHAYLGVGIPLKTVASILEKLEFGVKITRQTLRVTPPPFRQDITIPADVIEEIARIYGYHNLPSVVMPTRIPMTKPAGIHFAIENRMKHFLADIGWQEVYTYSMVSEALALQSGFPLAQHAKLLNPLTDDKVYLRRSLLPSLEEVLDNNPQLPEFSVFEIANVYQPKRTGLPAESLRLGLASGKPYRQAKGDLELLLQQFHIPQCTVELTDNPMAGKLMVGSVHIGRIGMTPQQRMYAELDMAALAPLLKTHPTYQPLPKTASIVEQLTFTLPSQTPVGPLLDDIARAHAYIKSAELTDVYRANHTVTVEYWSEKQNLSNEDVRPIRKKIVALAEKTHGAVLVGQVQ
jgi:phenylalanyl-tRNA synthetase beta chain